MLCPGDPHCEGIAGQVLFHALAAIVAILITGRLKTLNLTDKPVVTVKTVATVSDLAGSKIRGRDDP